MLCVVEVPHDHDPAASIMQRPLPLQDHADQPMHQAIRPIYRIKARLLSSSSGISEAEILWTDAVAILQKHHMQFKEVLFDNCIFSYFQKAPIGQLRQLRHASPRSGGLESGVQSEDTRFGWSFIMA